MDLDTDDILALLTQTHALKVAGLRRLRENFVSSLTGIVDFPRELHLNDCEFEADTAAALAVFLDAPDPNVHDGIMKDSKLLGVVSTAADVETRTPYTHIEEGGYSGLYKRKLMMSDIQRKLMIPGKSAGRVSSPQKAKDGVTSPKKSTHDGDAKMKTIRHAKERDILAGIKVSKKAAKMLNHLCMNGNMLGPGGALRLAFTIVSLRSIELRGSGLGPRDASAFADALYKNERLVSLDLSENPLFDGSLPGAPSVALRNNSHLRRLRLARTKLASGEGLARLLS